MLERLGSGLQDGGDLAQPRVGSTQLGLEIGVIGILLDEALVESRAVRSRSRRSGSRFWALSTSLSLTWVK